MENDERAGVEDAVTVRREKLSKRGSIYRWLPVVVGITAGAAAAVSYTMELWPSTERAAGKIYQGASRLEDLGELDRAGQRYAEIIEQYPDAQEAAWSKERLGEIRRKTTQKIYEAGIAAEERGDFKSAAAAFNQIAVGDGCGGPANWAKERLAEIQRKRAQVRFENGLRAEQNGDLDKAEREYEYIGNNFGDTIVAGWARDRLADVNRRKEQRAREEAERKAEAKEEQEFAGSTGFLHSEDDAGGDEKVKIDVPVDPPSRKRVEQEAIEARRREERLARFKRDLDGVTNNNPNEFTDGDRRTANELFQKILCEIIDREYKRSCEKIVTLNLGGISSEGAEHRILVNGQAEFRFLLIPDAYCFNGTLRVRKYNNGTIEYLSSDLGFRNTCR